MQVDFTVLTILSNIVLSAMMPVLEEPTAFLLIAAGADAFK